MHLSTDADLLALITSREPLHPDLQDYYTTDGSLGPCLRHPLVYHVMGVMPGLANAQYAAKKAKAHAAKQEGDWHSYVFLHERPWRLDAVLDIVGDARLTDIDYWTLLGQVWTDSENIWQVLDGWRNLLASHRAGREHLMTAEEQAAHAALPETVTVYRGAVAGRNEAGLSWTLDRAKAAWFSGRRMEGKGRPVVLTGTVAKADVLAFFQDRGEDEVLVADPAVVRQYR